MIEDILKKLSVEFHQEITSEKQVLYILAQIRKLIEGRNDLEALKFHCDWALHTKLNRRSARKLLEQLNGRYREVHQRGGDPEAMKELGRQLGLEALHTDFQEFLKQYGVDSSFLDATWWFGFLKYYLKIIQDCPLEGVAQPDWSFDSVVLVDPDLTAGTNRLHMQWEFSLNGQPVGLWLVSYDLPSLAERLLGKLRSGLMR